MTDAAPPSDGSSQIDPYRIDVHHHFFPPRWIAEEEGRMATRTTRDFSHAASWSPALSLEAMDRGGVKTAITSISTVTVRPDQPDAAQSLARYCNEYAARLAQDHKGRFGSFALLPLPHVAACLREIEYGVEVLRVQGFKLQTSYEDKWPGDPAFAAVFDELNRRKALVFFHPTAPGCCSNLVPGLAPPFMEYPFDTTRAIASLLFSGTIRRCPDIRFIFSHGGGTMPMLAHRIDYLVQATQSLAEHIPDGILAELQKLYFDVVTVTNAPAMAAILNVTSAAKILFGSDYPWIPVEKTVAELQRLGLNAGDLRAIERDNAVTLMPSLSASNAP